MKNLLLIGPLALFLTIGVNAADLAMDTVPAKPEAQATLTNWTQQPYNHWTFRNVGMHPSLMVPRAGKITLLPEALDQLFQG